MKKSLFSLGTLFVIGLKIQAQIIPPPAGFKLLKADGVNRQVDHYVKEGYDFMRETWTGESLENTLVFDAETAKFLAESYRTNLTTDLHFSSGVYYGLAHFSDKYFFIVLCRDNVYKISSAVRDAGFKKYSNWLLSMARKKTG